VSAEDEEEEEEEDLFVFSDTIDVMISVERVR
jgi:hypothetical protein